MSAFSTKAKKTPNRFEMLRKVPTSDKYKEVKPVVNTGFHIKKYLDKIQNSQQYAMTRKDEYFKRIKLETFLVLLIETGRENLVHNQECSVKEISPHQYNSLNTVPGSKGRFLSLHSVITGIGEMDFKNEQELSQLPKVPVNTYNYPYLLLDVREAEYYKRCHIVTAKNYPYTNLTRSYNFESRELLQFKNSKDKIIIMYDEDESVVPRVAATFVERGYENIFILTGGLKHAGSRFPSGLTAGTLPSCCLVQNPKLAPSRAHLSKEDINELQDSLELYPASSFSSVVGSGASSNASSKNSSISDVSKGSVKKKPPSLLMPVKRKPWK